MFRLPCYLRILWYAMGARGYRQGRGNNATSRIKLSQRSFSILLLLLFTQRGATAVLQSKLQPLRESVLRQDEFLNDILPTEEPGERLTSPNDDTLEIGSAPRVKAEVNVDELSCTYGETKASYGEVLRKTLQVGCLSFLIIIGMTLLGGCLLTIPFSLPGLVVAESLGCIAVNVLGINYSIWRYVGPGVLYQPGVTTNRLIFSRHIYLTILNKLCALAGTAVAARYAFLLEDGRVGRKLIRPRVIIGVFAALGMSAYSSYYAYTRGVPSYFRGSARDSLNDPACSGPLSWMQLPGYVRFVELSIVLTPILIGAPILGEIFALAQIVCSSIIIARRFSVFHRVTAAINLILIVPLLFLRCITTRRGS